MNIKCINVIIIIAYNMAGPLPNFSHSLSPTDIIDVMQVTPHTNLDSSLNSRHKINGMFQIT